MERHKGAVTVYSKMASYLIYGAVAQLGERLPCKEEVVGSSPISSIVKWRVVRSVFHYKKPKMNNKLTM